MVVVLRCSSLLVDTSCRSLSQTTTVWYFTGKTIETFIDLRGVMRSIRAALTVFIHAQGNSRAVLRTFMFQPC